MFNRKPTENLNSVGFFVLSTQGGYSEKYDSNIRKQSRR